MESTDSYKTIEGISEGLYTEKRSKFLSFAIPVRNVEEVKAYVAEYQKKFYDARHVCYAYMLGPKRLDFRANDNGEPSGTAGKPILGQINSNELTDILVIVLYMDLVSETISVALLSKLSEHVHCFIMPVLLLIHRMTAKGGKTQQMLQLKQFRLLAASMRHFLHERNIILHRPIIVRGKIMTLS